MKTMQIISSDWNGEPSFRLLPISKDAPFNECIYDPARKVLAIISKEHKEKPLFIPKLDDKGLAKVLKPARAPKGEDPGAPAEYQQQRIMMQTYFEYFVETPQDILDLINQIAVNPLHESLVTLGLRTRTAIPV